MKASLAFLISSLVFVGCGRKVETRDRVVDLEAYSAFHDIPALDNPALDAAAKAIVRIADTTGYGTGFFIDGTGKLVTNNHVVGVKNCPKSGCFLTIDVEYQIGHKFQKGKEVFAVPLTIDSMLDVSVLQLFESDRTTRLDSPAFLTLTGDHGPTLNGTAVYLIGHPGGGIKKWSSGSVFAYDGDWVEADYFSIPGTSGGPVLNGEGQVVGLNHRISGSAKSITENSYQQSAYFSSAGAVSRAIASNATSLSLVDPDTMPSRGDVARLEEAFFNARQSKVKVTTADLAPAETSVLAALGEACDASLAATEFPDPDAFDASLASCRAAMKWISCVAKDLVEQPYLSCPEGEERQAWEVRFAKRSGKYRAYWVNSLDYDSARTGGIFLADDDERDRSRQDLFKSELDRVSPPMTPGLAGRIYTRLGLASYGGVSVPDYLRNYDEIPNYNRYAYDIFFGLYYLYKDGIMSADDLRFELRSLIFDGSVPLGDKLDLEAIAYEMGLL